MMLGVAYIQTDAILEGRSAAVPVTSANIMLNPFFERGLGSVCNGHPDVSCDSLF